MGGFPRAGQCQQPKLASKALPWEGLPATLAGHDGLVGAKAGCAVEQHREKVRDQKKAAQPAADSAAPEEGSDSAAEGDAGK